MTAGDRATSRPRTVPIERRGLRDVVYDRILDLLLRGEVGAGERLSIDTLARELAVSPTPVREALVELERTGLVTRMALRGYRVAPPLLPDQLAELFEARLMLELEAVRRAMARADLDELVARMDRAQAHHRSAGERLMATMSESGPDVAAAHEYFTRDHQFHEVFFSLAGNRYLADMSVSLGAQTHRLRQAVLNAHSDVRQAIEEHEAVCDAVRGGDVEQACAAMSRHIQQAAERSVVDASTARPGRGPSAEETRAP